MPLSSRVAVPEGGKFGRHPDDRRLDAAPFEHFPERLAATQQLDATALERKLPAADNELPRARPSVRDVDRNGSIVFGSR